MQNYFALFSLEAGFAIDLEALELAYQSQISQFHPDKFVTKSEKEKSIALQNTSLINTAYEALKSPLLRATYLLELKNINAFDEKDTQMGTDFLMSQIALRESLESIELSKNKLDLNDFIENIGEKVKDNISKIEQNFEQNSLVKLKNLVRELKFYVQLSAQANQLMDE